MCGYNLRNPPVSQMIKTVCTSSGLPRNFVLWGGSTNSVEAEDKENGDLGAVAP